MQELVRKFEDFVKNQNLEEYVPKDFNFEEFSRGLASIQKMPICPGCRKGGGLLTCKIRVCALIRDVIDCSKCDLLTDCKNFEELEKTHPKIKEDLIRIKNENRPTLIKRWTDELKSKWPHCVLFCVAAKK